jgi:hypothetical protein
MRADEYTALVAWLDGRERSVVDAVRAEGWTEPLLVVRALVEARRALAAIEWVNGHCPHCTNDEWSGHAVDCIMTKLPRPQS